jgi:hypothetical protein
MIQTLRLCSVLALSATLVSGLGRPAAAASGIKEEMKEVAKGISSELRELGKTKVDVKGFEFKGSDSKLQGAAGPGIAQVLAEALQNEKLIVEKGADLMIRGTYVDVIDSKSKLLAAQIKGELVDSNDRTILSFSRGVFGDESLASLFGATTTIKPTDDVKARSVQLIEAIDNPTVAVEDTRISAKKGDPYHIEVHVLQGGKYVPRAPTTVDGQAFVKINRDEVYAIKLFNDSAEEASVAVTVDGLSAFTFSENKDYTQYIVGAKSSFLLKGWHRSNTVSDSFQVMEYSKSAVAQKLPTSTSIGVVTATFSVCFPKDAPPPEDEPPSSTVNKFSRTTADATGRGPEVKDKFKEVERIFGVVRTSISVRYTK